MTKNKYEDAQLPLFSALMGYVLGDKEAEDYLVENEGFERN